jgi:hypothetical protein
VRSHLIDQCCSNREILTECITYGVAGIATTRELIVVAAWHLFARTDLKMRFLDGDEMGRIAMLEEVLRLEPVVGVLYRRAEQNLFLDDDGRAEAYRPARCSRSTFELSTPIPRSRESVLTGSIRTDGLRIIDFPQA